MDFWPLLADEALAREHWTQARTMMRCFEHWFGPYPFYEDGYKLIQAPYLGMEHQTAVTYGNGFRNGYLGSDLSGSGYGLQWDYIIVHESAHEWFANNITAADDADMWLHEGFAMYAEGLYTECLTGDKEAGAAYIRGVRARISNDRPIQGIYGVNYPGSGNMYDKGANILHTVRQLVNDDEKWRQVLRGLNREFRHQTVTSAQVEGYIARETGLDLTAFWQQYVRTTMIPQLEYRLEGRTLSYRWVNVVDGFAMPVRVTLGPGRVETIRPTQQWQTVETGLASAGDFRVDPNFYVTTRSVGAL
jgi:aminopeptidase N